MAICGYKCSLCMFVISLWGVIQLLIMGVLFYAEAPALLEDLPEEPASKTEEFMTIVHRGYRDNAFNCFIASCLYLVTLGVSGWQFYLNQKTTYQV
ncbi:hypothetical protein Pmani_016643 [Petrolisthes manimaculis]|uniref:Uncharacterized protein n=1 Tax=Petrolisthes manimaculis TaxID=1843537 RepID=A0AAE1U6I0_9EUCA|nr:hypothetical protein Pmani_016643 [Petrolisthes manimaculis]